jgi:hypothetical protein
MCEKLHRIRHLACIQNSQYTYEMYFMLPILTLLTWAQTGSGNEDFDRPPLRIILQDRELIGWPKTSQWNNPRTQSIEVTLDAPWDPPRTEVITRNKIVDSREMGRNETKARLKREWESRGGVQLDPPNGIWVHAEELALAERAMNRNKPAQPEANVLAEETGKAVIDSPESELSFFQAWGYHAGVAMVGLFLLGGILTWWLKRADWGSIRS